MITPLSGIQQMERAVVALMSCLLKNLLKMLVPFVEQVVSMEPKMALVTQKCVIPFVQMDGSKTRTETVPTVVIQLQKLPQKPNVINVHLKLTLSAK